MKTGRRLGVLMLAILMAGAGTFSARAEPGPFERLFRALRHGVSEPHRSSTHRSKHKQIQDNEDAPVTGNETTVRPANGTVTKPPNEKNTRGASKATARKGDDLPYGQPVPGKQGFVTSPFSPNSGYIDVRGFSPGTPVKDPYTGKVFLTP